MIKENDKSVNKSCKSKNDNHNTICYIVNITAPDAIIHVLSRNNVKMYNML